MSDPYLEELTRRNKELAAAQAPQPVETKGPTSADEPPWPGWFSCEDCFGWFDVPPEVYESGVQLCPLCAGRREAAVETKGPWKTVQDEDLGDDRFVERHPTTGKNIRATFYGPFTEPQARGVADTLNRLEGTDG